MLRVKVTVHHNIISVVYPYRLFRCELKSLGDISCRQRETDRTRLDVLKAPHRPYCEQFNVGTILLLYH